MRTLFNFLAILFISLLLPICTNAQNTPELGKYVEQYEGRLGARTFDVYLLRIGAKSNEEVLIQVSGVDDAIDGKIFKYKKKWLSSDKHLNKYKYRTTQVPGKEQFSLFHSDNYYGSQIFKVYLMDNPMKAINVYPKDYQKNLDPIFIYKQYLKQQKARQAE